MVLTVAVNEQRYKRKAWEYSVWIMDGEKKVFCAHSLTDKPTAQTVADAFACYLQHGGEKAIRDASEALGY